MPEKKERPEADAVAAKKLEAWAAQSGAYRAFEQAAERADERARALNEKRQVAPSVLDEPCTV